MKNREKWVATKFIKKDNRFEPSNNPEYVSIGSRLIAYIQAEYYSKVIQEHSKGILLDLGCGYVPWYEAYSSLVTDNICIDWENSNHQNIHLDKKVDLNQKIPIEDSSFDTVLATDVLEHISNPKLCINEIERLLKPNGKLILAVPFLYKIHEPPHDYYRYTEYILKEFMDSCGLKILILEPYGGLPEVFLDLIAKHIVKYKKISYLYLSFCRKILKTPAVKKFSEKTSNGYPLGYCLVAEKQSFN